MQIGISELFDRTVEATWDHLIEPKVASQANSEAPARGTDGHSIVNPLSGPLRHLERSSAGLQVAGTKQLESTPTGTGQILAIDTERYVLDDRSRAHGVP